jgi:hypothetical protein
MVTIADELKREVNRLREEDGLPPLFPQVNEITPPTPKPNTFTPHRHKE